MRRFVLFGVAGTLGFIVDAGLAEALIKLLMVNFYFARLISFLCAVATTYAFNQRYTFADRISGKRHGQKRRYFVTMTAGFCLNYGIYATLGFYEPFFQRWPVLAIVAGSFAGLLVNYSGARYWVFRPDNAALESAK